MEMAIVASTPYTGTPCEEVWVKSRGARPVPAIEYSRREPM